MIPPPQADGLLPPGRHAATWSDVEQRFVFNSWRREIWSDLLVATELLSDVVPILELWLGGSFATLRPNPQDADVVYFLSASDLAVARDADRLLLGQFANSGLKSQGYRVDSYTVTRFVPRSSDPVEWTADEKDYLETRGWWDEHWMRRKQRSRNLERQHRARRGYLEVMIDDA